MTRPAHWRWLSVLLVLVAGVGAGIFIVQQPGEVIPSAPGVSQTLARERAQRLSAVSYNLRLRVPDARNGAIRGSITAEFTLTNSRRPLVFDFAQPADRLLSVSANGASSKAVVEQGHIVVPSGELVEGRNSITFDFIAGDEPLNRQDDLLYSLFVPARASLAFPCFDQPDIKAQWQLSLDVPHGWSAVSNGRETGRVAAGDHIGYLFDRTEPISTYLFAFAAGRFEVESAERNGRTFRLFHRETNKERFARNREVIVDQHAQALDWMEDYTGIPYRFGKFDLVLLPSFQFSGMEHPGAVFYNADSVLLDETATQARLLARANVIAHETAHMWFGDLVTMTWFDDVWMKEVFANFMAAKIVNPSFPDMNHDLRFLVQHYPAAYDVDRTDGANPIRQPLANLRDAGSLYGAIIYQKAPIVVRQLELLMGESALRDGLREYLASNEFGNASWSDLVDVLDRRTARDLLAWSRAWVDEAGRPTLSIDLRTNEGVITELTLRQSDPRGRNLSWPQRAQVLLGYGTIVRVFDVMLDDVDAVVPVAGFPEPDWVLPVGGGLAYGEMNLDTRTLAFLSRDAQTIADPVARAAAYIARWEAMLDGQLMPAAVLDAALGDLSVETEELTVQLLLDQTRSVFWRFTPAADRGLAAARLEPVLRAGFDRAATSSAKAAWFAAIRSTALSPQAVSWLEDIWARRVRIDGFQLSDTDETDLMMDLAIRLEDRADAMISAQSARIDNADRRARLAFIAPALSPDRTIRQAFFERLGDVQHRAREAWVLDAVRYLHHPLRADESQHMVRPALAMLHDIHATGDIFFPKRWADATLGGYQTSAVAADVQAFIETLPLDYPVRLRWVLLSSADTLFRAATLAPR